MATTTFIHVKNNLILDTIFEFSINHPETDIVLTIDRKKIDYNTPRTTKKFFTYVKKRNNKIKIERLNAGANKKDDGYDSLKEDMKYMDIIHIDPWKVFTRIETGIHNSINMIYLCYKTNPELQYEIGTDEKTRPYLSEEEFDFILREFQGRVIEKVYSKIRYVRIQGKGEKKIRMSNIAKKYGLIPKSEEDDLGEQLEKIKTDIIGLQENRMIESTESTRNNIKDKIYEHLVQLLVPLPDIFV